MLETIDPICTLHCAVMFLGMVKAFTNAANFSGMALFNTSMKLSDIVHKVFFEVDNGLEAAYGSAAARERLIPDYSLWTRQPKVIFLISINMAATIGCFLMKVKTF